MKKKGFTLIELLAVIVILAVIAIITVPTILGVIDRARKASYKDSVYGIIESARIYLASNQDITKEIEFVCNEEECKRTNGDKLEFKGTVPKSGSIYIKEDGSILVESLYNGRYYANNETGEVVITEDDSTMTRGELTQVVKDLTNKYNAVISKNNDLQNQINNLKSTTTSIDEVYPVGSIYISTSEINPSDLFKGTEWERYSEGRTLVGEGDGYTAGSTGGSKTVTLTTSNLPSHNHSIPSLSGTAALNGAHTHAFDTGGIALVVYANSEHPGMPRDFGFVSSIDSWWSGVKKNTASISSAGAHTHSVTTTASTSGSTGSGTSFSVQNPYVVVYMWKRIK